MPIISNVGRKAWSIRLLTTIMYVILLVLGVTMVVPFLITLTASVSTPMDYQRFSVAPRAFWSQEERFVRGMVPYYPETMRNAFTMFRADFPTAPGEWTNWQSVGRDVTLVDAFAGAYLKQADDPQRWGQVTRMAADYDAFSRAYPLADSLCSINEQDVAPYYRDYYLSQVPTSQDREERALALLGESWGVPFESFYGVRPTREQQTPLDQPNYWPPNDGRADDFTRLRQAYLERRFVPNGIKGKWLSYARSQGLRQPARALFPVTKDADPAVQDAWATFTASVTPACETRPFSMRLVWLKYLGSPAQRERIGLKPGGEISVAEYNELFGTQYAALTQVPFPPDPTTSAKLAVSWEAFVQKAYPLRLIEVRVTPALSAGYQQFLQTRFKSNLARLNEVAGTAFTSWSAIMLPATMPRTREAQANLWIDYVNSLPMATKNLHCAETAYQAFLLERYDSVAAINTAYGLEMTSITQAQLPFDMAYLVTFTQNERQMFFASLGENYRFVVDYMLRRGRAGVNTVILILLSLLASLTINPLAAYALSRFQMKQTPGVILFMLATMAFPAAVSMIPGYLLMRDMHMLNSYWALILPGVANGMSIFLLKGFFDSLPPELYEAAALDGAKEWQVFLRITLPLSKPILAVIALNTFMHAYNSWEWALVVCQNPKMWTLAVWLYQFNTTWGQQPWAVMASFVLASLPVFIMFLLCQNIILRGIILPQMK